MHKGTPVPDLASRWGGGWTKNLCGHLWWPFFMIFLIVSGLWPLGPSPHRRSQGQECATVQFVSFLCRLWKKRPNKWLVPHPTSWVFTRGQFWIRHYRALYTKCGKGKQQARNSTFTQSTTCLNWNMSYFKIFDVKFKRSNGAEWDAKLSGQRKLKQEKSLIQMLILSNEI